jgi:hypothetical protein
MADPYYEIAKSKFVEKAVYLSRSGYFYISTKPYFPDFESSYTLINYEPRFNGNIVTHCEYLEYNGDQVYPTEADGTLAHWLSQYKKLENISLSQFEKVCDDILYKIKQIKYKIALSKINEDF